MYRHTVFISYKKKGAYEEWINAIFFPILRNYFIDKCGKNHAFLDVIEQAEYYGDSLDNFLNSSLVHSKCMIAVLNGPYFCNSEWCLKEFSIMKYRTEKYNKKLLMPVIFTKKDVVSNTDISLLKDACPRFSTSIEKYYRPLFLEKSRFLLTNEAFRNGPDYNVLVAEIENWMEGSVVPSIIDAPEWDSNWDTKEWLEAPYVALKNEIDCQKIYQQSFL